MGVRTAISPRLYFVIAAPTNQMARTTATIATVSLRSTAAEYPWVT